MSDSETVTLKEFVLLAVKAETERIHTILNERASQLKLTADALRIELQHLNELRTAVERDRSEFLRRDVYDKIHEGLAESVKKLELWQANVAGRTFVLLLFCGTFGGLIGTLVARLWK